MSNRLHLVAWCCCIFVLACSISPGAATAAEAAGTRHGSWRAEPARASAETWSSFGIHTHHFVGTWHGQLYQAVLYMRVICNTDQSHLVRMVVSIHDTPKIRTAVDETHSETPAWYVTAPKSSSGNLPRVWFQGPHNISIEAAVHDWEHHMRTSTTAALMSSAELPAGVPFAVRMQGSERVHHLQEQCNGRKHPLFVDTSIWLAVVASERSPGLIGPSSTQQQLTGHHAGQNLLKEGNSNNTTGSNGSVEHTTSINITAAVSQAGSALGTTSDVRRFLVMQHLQHHRKLGFAGSIMVVTPHAASALMRSRAIRRAVLRRDLVLVLWQEGLELRASHFMQIPANNLLRLAAWGSNINLAFWDLDEYLVMPQHRNIQLEVQSGCLKVTPSSVPEVIIPSNWVSAPSWAPGAEMHGWLAHGHWAAAVRAMGYVSWNYAYCSGVCKVLVDPNTDMMFQVHGHARTPRDTSPSKEVPRSCAYLLHFYRLWRVREPELFKKVASNQGVPLLMDEVLPVMTHGMDTPAEGVSGIDKPPADDQ